MHLLKTLFCILFVIVSNLCFAGLKAASPASVAEMEAYAINNLIFQTGCARPDLSDSVVDGTAVLDISFAQNGSPLGAEIISSNGSDSDNVKIIEALTKRCKYSSSPVELPLGASKQFTYKWKAHQDSSGLQSCMLFNIAYPGASRRLHEQGKAVVSYRYVGSGYESKISQSTGYPRLDEVALKTINKCLDNHAFQSAPDGNKWLEVAMMWKIEGNNESSSSAQNNSTSSSASAQN